MTGRTKPLTPALSPAYRGEGVNPAAPPEAVGHSAHREGGG